MALKSFLILSRPRSGHVEGRTTLIQLDYGLFCGNDELDGRQGFHNAWKAGIYGRNRSRPASG
jgi:hypothetical protein